MGACEGRMVSTSFKDKISAWVAVADRHEELGGANLAARGVTGNLEQALEDPALSWGANRAP